MANTKVGRIKSHQCIFMDVATAVNSKCHDCQKEIEIEGKEIKNGVMLAYEKGGKKINVFKCQSCFEQSQSLQNFQPCEVYSRIVGYLRPVNQWNLGKKEEFADRQEYKM